ncbi:hypothetical protein B1B_00591 [mine drainage metagenome]|uniref:Transposase IS30-like HTH domain-containing protein n=1 Tax=mine drainage metagenome TaxID=410659 RepID=T1CBI9_9ZZZZ
MRQGGPFHVAGNSFKYLELLVNEPGFKFEVQQYALSVVSCDKILANHLTIIKGVKMLHYTQLTYEQRYQIYGLKQAKLNQSEIAETIRVHRSTISREFRRNKGMKGLQT